MANHPDDSGVYDTEVVSEWHVRLTVYREDGHKTTELLARYNVTPPQSFSRDAEVFGFLRKYLHQRAVVEADGEAKSRYGEEG